MMSSIPSWLFRNGLILYKTNQLLDKHFPGMTRPSLLEIERNASVAFSFGHPLLIDGLRPLAPNYINLGMMNCVAPKLLPKDLEDFMNSGGKDPGIIYVSFGSVLQANRMSEKRYECKVNDIT